MVNDIMLFYIEAEKLKSALRHSYTSDTRRQESTAEHSWMLCLMAITLFEKLSLEIDQLKVLKMLIVHDLAEALTGDIPAFEVSKRKQHKQKNELVAMKKITKSLNAGRRNEIISLWSEYEERKTLEGKFAYMLDKLEAALQHCIAGIETWDQNDFDYHGAFYKHDFAEFGPNFVVLRDAIGEMTMEKVLEADQFDRLNDFIKNSYKTLTQK